MAFEQPLRYGPRPRRWLRAVLLSLGVVVLLCAVGAAGLGLWSYQSVRAAYAPAQAAAEQFLTRLVDGDAAGAYALLCATTRQRWPQPEFTRLAAAPPLVRYVVRDVQVTSRGGRPRAAVTVGLIRQSGGQEVRVMPVVRDTDSAWRVCGDPF